MEAAWSSWHATVAGSTTPTTKIAFQSFFAKFIINFFLLWVR
jgi:hypothetical protein